MNASKAMNTTALPMNKNRMTSAESSRTPISAKKIT